MTPPRYDVEPVTALALDRSDPPWIEEWAAEYERHLPVTKPEHLHA